MEVCSQNMSDPCSILLKLVGNKCNMVCEYCSELPKQYGKEQCLFDRNKIFQILRNAPKDAEIILHGGEPTLIGIEKLSDIVRLIKSLDFSSTPSIQTNGFLGDCWIDFFKENSSSLRISISIDGNRVCNGYRKARNADADETFDTVLCFINKLDAAGIEFRCIATINSLSWDKGKDILAFFQRFRHLKFLKLNPCFDIEENGLKPWAITPSQYLKCLIDVFHAMLELKTYEKFKLDPIMDIISHLEVVFHALEFKCDKFRSVYPGGLVTPCDVMDETTLCSITLEHIFDSQQLAPYIEAELAECELCENLSICAGGCPSLKSQYRRFNPTLLSEYCDYRVKIRDYLKAFIAKGEQKECPSA